MQKEAFTRYECQYECLRIGIALKQLAKIVKRAQDSEQVTIRVEGNDLYAEITFTNIETNKVSEFQLDLINAEEDSLIIPDLKSHDVEFTLDSIDFAKMGQSFSDLNDTLHFIMKVGDRLTLSTVGTIGAGHAHLRP